MTWFWESIAWQWPFVVGTLAEGLTMGLIIALSSLITRWWMRRHFVEQMPEESRSRVKQAQRVATHYKELYERECQKTEAYRTVIRSSIATASHTLMNLKGVE